MSLKNMETGWLRMPINRTRVSVKKRGDGACNASGETSTAYTSYTGVASGRECRRVGVGVYDVGVAPRRVGACQCRTAVSKYFLNRLRFVLSVIVCDLETKPLCIGVGFA